MPSTDFGFADPAYLLLLLVLPLFLLWYVLRYRRQRLVIRLSYDPKNLHAPKRSLAFLRHLPLALMLLGLGLAIFALARPQKTEERVVRRGEGIDIMLLLDVSGSMETEDFAPNRLEVAKIQASRFVQGRKNDRIGVVLFAENAYSYVPLTLDYSLLRELIASVDFSLVPSRGTAIGLAMAAGINRLRETDSDSKVMILLTDGESNQGQISPIVAARLAAQFGIKVYTIGVGRDVQTRRSSTQPFDLRRDEAGVDEATLEEVARITGGAYFRATDETGLASIFDRIGTLETTLIEEELFRRVSDRYLPFLMGGVACFLVAFLLINTFLGNPLEY